jgi:hypothetical protein
MIKSIIRYLQDRIFATKLILHKTDLMTRDVSDVGVGFIQAEGADPFLSQDMIFTVSFPDAKKTAKVKWTRKFEFRGYHFQRSGLEWIKL